MADKIGTSGRACSPAASREGARDTVLGTIPTAVVYTLSPTMAFPIVPSSRPGGGATGASGAGAASGSGARA